MRGVREAWVAGAIVVSAVLAAPAGALRTTVGGRDIDLDATVAVREVFEANRSTTHDRTLERVRMHAAVAFAPWLRFDSTTVATNGGPTMRARGGGVYDWTRTFQDLSPAIDFEEAYVDASFGAVDLRVGKQKIAWGKLDRLAPNDLLNPLSFIDPFMYEETERKIGVPAIQASYYAPASLGAPPESRLTAVWVPRYLPYRFPTGRCDVQGDTSSCHLERWFPPAAVPDPLFRVPAGLLPLPPPIGGSNTAFTVPLSYRVANDGLPGFRLENSGIGLRYSALVHDADVAAYFYHGFDAQPAFRLRAEAVGPPPDFTDLPNADITGATTLTPVFRHIDAAGADGAYVIDRFTFRVEGAFVHNRPFARDIHNLVTDPAPLAPALGEALAKLAAGAGRAAVPLPNSYAVRDAVEWGAGVDYLYDGYLLLFQFNQTDVLANNVDLLIADTESRLLMNVRKSFFADTLHTQVVTLHAIESDYTLFRPRLTYDLTDHLAAEVGYLLIAGRRASVLGQYGRNDQGWLRLEYRI